MKFNGIFSFVLISLVCFAVSSGPVNAAISDSDFLDLCETGTLQQIEEAIKDGANINARNDDQETPLMLAAWSNSDPEVITALVKAGAQVNEKDKVGDTPLMFATTSNSNPDVTAALVKAGADINAKNNEGSTALILAVKNNPPDIEAVRVVPNPEVILTLLQLGADPKIKDNEGKMAIDYAKEVESLKDTDAIKKLSEVSA